MSISLFSMPRRRRPGRPARGFSIVTAIFLLVVLSALGVALLSISTMQHAESALDVQGARAYQAARAGMEWGVYRQRVDGKCITSSDFALPANGALNGFRVTVRCTQAAGALPRFQVIATACNQPVGGVCATANATNNPDYVQRVVQAEF
ncbi:MAG: agglutinin biogenesis protein MshP [Janthinobacterium svalbardensis]|uniref:Agglutinin biogenesis protein MshP n=1 Tax=Janthinobacterium svalbardensis TaxID=368607 RepID=A0A290WYV1_9BURK|nr:agglutinin biogenesis protein MshP [Janthinobacterium svalbardensis]ATD61878.1 agglutinin biogenesis protein MshP [Janthinobacterium svalbardensis]